MSETTKKPTTPSKSFWADFLHRDDSFFSREFWPFRGGISAVPAVNVKENGDAFILEMAAAGLSKEDFKIETENNVLKISAEKTETKEDETETYRRKEYNYNSFTRSFEMPDNVRESEISATYADGVLTITLPKFEKDEETERRSISIE